MCQMRYDNITDDMVKAADCMSCQCSTSAKQHNWTKDDDGNWWCTSGNHS